MWGYACVCMCVCTLTNYLSCPSTCVRDARLPPASPGPASTPATGPGPAGPGPTAHAPSAAGACSPAAVPGFDLPGGSGPADARPDATRASAATHSRPPAGTALLLTVGGAAHDCGPWCGAIALARTSDGPRLLCLMGAPSCDGRAASWGSRRVPSSPTAQALARQLSGQPSSSSGGR